MTINTNEIRIVVHVEGGLVQAVYSNASIPIRVAIQDFDINGADGDEIATLDDGTEFIGHVEATFRDNLHVAAVFAALGEDIPAIDPQHEDYVAHKGKFCPNCGSCEIEANGTFDADGSASWSNVVCKSCSSGWTEDYRLIGFHNLDATPLPVIESVSV